MTYFSKSLFKQRHLTFYILFITAKMQTEVLLNIRDITRIQFTFLENFL